VYLCHANRRLIIALASTEAKSELAVVKIDSARELLAGLTGQA
jgi:hypothetical protein